MHKAIVENNVELLEERYNTYTKNLNHILPAYIDTAIYCNSVKCYEFFKQRHLDLILNAINYEAKKVTDGLLQLVLINIFLMSL